MICVVHPVSGSWVFNHPGSRGKKGTGSRIRNIACRSPNLNYSCRLSTSRCTWPSSTRRGRITTKRPKPPPPPAACLLPTPPLPPPFRGATTQAHTHTPPGFSCCWYYFMNMPTCWFFFHTPNNVAYYIQGEHTFNNTYYIFIYGWKFHFFLKP